MWALRVNTLVLRFVWHVFYYWAIFPSSSTFFFLLKSAYHPSDTHPWSLGLHGWCLVPFLRPLKSLLGLWGKCRLLSSKTGGWKRRVCGGQWPRWFLSSPLPYSHSVDTCLLPGRVGLCDGYDTSGGVWLPRLGERHRFWSWSFFPPCMICFVRSHVTRSHVKDLEIGAPDPNKPLMILTLFNPWRQSWQRWSSQLC